MTPYPGDPQRSVTVIFCSDHGLSSKGQIVTGEIVRYPTVQYFRPSRPHPESFRWIPSSLSNGKVIWRLISPLEAIAIQAGEG